MPGLRVRHAYHLRTVEPRNRPHSSALPPARPHDADTDDDSAEASVRTRGGAAQSRAPYDASRAGHGTPRMHACAPSAATLVHRERRATCVCRPCWRGGARRRAACLRRRRLCGLCRSWPSRAPLSNMRTRAEAPPALSLPRRDRPCAVVCLCAAPFASAAARARAPHVVAISSRRSSAAGSPTHTDDDDPAPRPLPDGPRTLAAGRAAPAPRSPAQRPTALRSASEANVAVPEFWQSLERASAIVGERPPHAGGVSMPAGVPAAAEQCRGRWWWQSARRRIRHGKALAA